MALPPVKCSRAAARYTPEMRLDFDLSAQLVLNTCLLQLALEENLQGNNKLGALLTGEVDISEFSLAQRLSYLKVRDLFV
jgi:hypothetical protein